MSEEKRRRFSGRTYATPFGRFQATGSTESPANKVLIGREGRRAYFIDLLLRLQRRGAILVTGRRGAGKTSFVRYGLKEYEEEVFERFLASNVGKATFWDRVGVMVVGLLTLAVFLMLSDLMEVLIVGVGSGNGNGTGQAVLAWLLVIPLALVCAYPILFAAEIARESWRIGLSLLPVSWLRPLLSSKIDKSSEDPARTRETAASPLIAWITVLASAVVLWWFGIFGAPAFAASQFFLVLSLVYLFSEILPIRRDMGDTKRFWIHVVYISPMILLCHYTNPLRPEATSDPAITSLVILSVSGGFLCIGVGLLIQHLRRVDLQHKREEERAPSSWTRYITNSGYLIASAVLTWASTASLLVMADALLIMTSRLPIMASALLIMASEMPIRLILIISLFFTLIVFVVVFFLRSLATRATEESPEPAEPRPLLAVVLTAILLLTIALQLLHPLLAHWEWPRHLEQLGFRARFTEATSKPVPLEALRPPESLAAIPGLQRRGETRRSPLVEGMLSPLERLKKTLLQSSEDLQETFLTRAPAAGSSDLFHSVREEIYWLAGTFFCFLLIYFMQYEWVVRPMLRYRQDSALYSKVDPENRDPQIPPPKLEDIEQKDLRNMANLTLPWLLQKTWLPLLVISVNLGFERLDHRRVIHAMLAELRSKYHRRFLAWNSGIANLGRVLGLLLFIALVTLVTDRWFNMPVLDKPETTSVSIDHEHVRRVAKNQYQDVCDLFQGRQQGPGIANLVCLMPWGNSLIHGLYFNLIPEHVGDVYRDKRQHILFYFLPYRSEAWPSSKILKSGSETVLGAVELQPMLQPGFEFRVYHLLLFVVFFIFGRWLLLRFQLFPYRHSLRRIDEVMEHLSARTSVTSRRNRWKPTEWIQNLFMNEQIHQAEQDPLDPRIIEFAFLEVIEEIQDAYLRPPAGQTHVFSLPAPEITFVFDELDKLGTRISPDEGDSSGRAEQVEILHAERRRSRELHKLLADMKNLLSSAPARFIFVGGRNLHDEWLADQTARQPMLTNIFQAEIYLPSLLVDHRTHKRPRLSHNIKLYLQKQKDRAERLHAKYELNRSLPSFSLIVERQEPETFVEVQREPPDPGLEFFDCDSLAEFPGERELERDFVQFLTYRSMGNPKKLKEMVMSYCRPVARFVESIDSKPFSKCQHILVFADPGRFRVQFLSDVYRHIVLRMERRLLERDDKLVISIFYLADFLFKFHQRAFSWGNLERVDELVHIHRAPDLRDLLGVLVNQWSERFLHPIRNGMYDFRFRSELAQEIEFISRQSDDEMAAFNFTLDESLTLKSLYESNIEKLSKTPEASEELVDQIAGLGELHEFDQEYDTARYHYRRAIGLLDRELVGITGKGGVFDDRTPTIEILSFEGRGPQHVRRYMTWGIARLRLMLQIGMTYELARDLEHAHAEYRNARTLAHALIMSMLGKDQDGVDEQLDVLKHLNILFQPAFAEAWVTEKLPGGVDTSITLAEKAIWHLRRNLPFVKEPKLEASKNAVNVQNSNFSLVAAELHNKVGDLYFFKGRQIVRPEDVKTWQQATDRKRPRRGFEGYLLKAHYHYAVGLHDLRRYVSHRIRSSEDKLNIWSSKAVKGEKDGGENENYRTRQTIAPGGWPDFVFRAAGGGLLDLAEAMLGRVSLFALFKFLNDSAPDGALPSHRDWPSGLRKWLVDEFTDWFEEVETGEDDVPENQTPLRFPMAKKPMNAGNLRDWLGRWRRDRNPYEDDRQPQEINLLEFNVEEHHDDPARLLTSIQFTLVGAKYLERGGYLEDSARELLGVCQTVTNYLWWCLSSSHALQWAKDFGLENEGLVRGLDQAVGNRLLQHPFWKHLAQVAVYSLEKADRLFRISRRAEEEEDGYLIGDKIPTTCLTLACSLGLAAQCLDANGSWLRSDDSSLKAKLQDLLESWTAGDKPTGDDWWERLQGRLEAGLVRHSYPMMNRLHTLKVLIDSRVLAQRDRWTRDEMNEVIDCTDELLDLRSRFNAPLHFTPLHTGTTAAQVYLRCRHDLLGQTDEDWPKLTQIRRAAGRELRRSEEMCTMRRGYYEEIADLYYLYDDFNERRLHFNHALQMAGNGLVSFMAWLVGRPDVRGEKGCYLSRRKADHARGNATPSPSMRKDRGG